MRNLNDPGEPYDVVAAMRAHGEKLSNVQEDIHVLRASIEKLLDLEKANSVAIARGDVHHQELVRRQDKLEQTVAGYIKLTVSAMFTAIVGLASFLVNWLTR